MKINPIAVIAGFLALAFVVGLFQQRQTPQARNGKPMIDYGRAIAALQNHYAASPVGGGWQLQQIRQEGDRVSVAFLMPNDLAISFDEKTIEQKIAIGRLACPGSKESVWNAIDPGSVEIVLVNRGAIVFNTVCR